MKNATTVEDENGKIILVIPENSGLGTKKLAPIGNSQHVIIDRKMMDAAGVEIGDLVYVLVWSVDSKRPKEVEDHE